MARPARLLIVGTTQRLAVYGHHLAGHEGRHRLGPLHETALELLRVQPGENVAEEPAPASAGANIPGKARALLTAPDSARVMRAKRADVAANDYEGFNLQ